MKENKGNVCFPQSEKNTSIYQILTECVQNNKSVNGSI